ncbi:MAG: DUF308 domain-containing protein [Bacilli bacterium]|nr:DUF308 domain-containing protein [Bacilli bacterium]
MGRFIRTTSSDKFKKLMSTSIASSVVLILVGFVMLFLPKLTNKIIGIIIGVMFLVSGFNMVYKYLKRDGAKLYSFNMIFGIILFVLGLIIILVPFSVSSFITVCLGLYLVVMGANKITYGVWFKIGNDPAWLITVVIGIMLIVFGIMVIVNPFSSLTITQLAGAFLIISGILDMTDVILLRKRSDEITKIFW